MRFATDSKQDYIKCNALSNVRSLCSHYAYVHVFVNK